MYEITYQNGRHAISMGQFHHWNLHFIDSDDRSIIERIEGLHVQSCYGEITHKFHNELSKRIERVEIKTYFGCLTDNFTNMQDCMENIGSFCCDSAWSLYSSEELSNLILNIYEILQRKYNINHIVNVQTSKIPFSSNSYDDYKKLGYKLIINAYNILPHALFFILNIYRRLFTLSNKITNDIVFALTKNATVKWCDLDAVALMILFDYFNVYSPNDSRIGWCYNANLDGLKCFLDENSFSQFNVIDKVEKSNYFKYSDVFSAIIKNTKVDSCYVNVNDSYCNDIAFRYGLPSPFLFYNDSYTITLEELLTSTVCTDSIINQIETYIGFLKAMIASNNR